MKFSEVDEVLQNVKFTGSRKGKFLYDFVTDHRLENILELGFAHGTSTCYMAAALQERGAGKVTAVDIEDSLNFSPTLEEQAAGLKLAEWITPVREKSSYTWFLKKEIERNSAGSVCTPVYDMCFIDGPKDWTNDGAAFFYVDKLLKPGGWILFDDYSWTYREAERIGGGTYTRGYVFEKMSEQEYAEPQIASVFNLLVRQHPGYSNFSVIDGDLAMAQKVGHSAGGTNKMEFRTSATPSYVAFAAAKWMRRKFRRTPRSA